MSNTGCPKSLDPFLKLHISKNLIGNATLTTYLERDDSLFFFGAKFNPIGNPLVCQLKLKQMAAYHAILCICTPGDHL